MFNPSGKVAVSIMACSQSETWAEMFFWSLVLDVWAWVAGVLFGKLTDESLNERSTASVKMPQCWACPAYCSLLMGIFFGG